MKLLGRKIGFKAFKSKLFQSWAKDEILDIIDLINEFYLIIFTMFLSYEYVLIGRLWLIYDHYLTIRK